MPNLYRLEFNIEISDKKDLTCVPSAASILNIVNPRSARTVIGIQSILGGPNLLGMK